MSANDKQIGGEHYKSKIQHWDYVVANDLDYFQAQITKYVTRWKKKNGYQDLLKALHFLEKYIEIEGKKPKGGEYATPTTDDLTGVKKYPDDYQEQLAIKMSKMREDAMTGISEHLRAEMTRPMFDKSFGDLIIKSSKEIVDQLNNLQPEKEYVSPMLKNFWGGEEPHSQGYVNQDGPDQYPSKLTGG